MTQEVFAFVGRIILQGPLTFRLDCSKVANNLDIPNNLDIEGHFIYLIFST